MRMNILSTILSFALVSAAFGHGVQIQITHDAATGKIQTRDVVSTSSAPSALSDLKRVYVMPLMPFTGPAGSGWYTRPEGELNPVTMLPLHPTGPGLTYQYDSQLFGSGWAFNGSSSLPNLQGSEFGYNFAAGLAAWDGAAFSDAGVEELQMFRGSGSSVPAATALTSDVGPFDGITFGAISTMSGNPHSSAGFLLFGNGSSSAISGSGAGDDGIYLAQLTVSSTAVGVLDSDPIYFVMYKNTGVAAAVEAAGHLGFDASLMTIVPEPASALLLISAGALILRRRDR